MIPTFYHSGEIGDLLYGLKAISKSGMGNLYVGENLRVSFDPATELLAHPNKVLSPRDFAFIKDLLECQPYLNEVIYGEPEHIDYNLNLFRKEIFKQPHLNFENLFVHVCGINVDPTDSNIPWLKCGKKQQKPITAIRVSRRTHDRFPWKEIVQKYHNDIIFLGTQSEYRQFTEYTGKEVEWNDYTNLLKVCEVINGAKLHIGNCTSISVCAEGLKKPMIYENELTPDNIRYPTHEFDRENRINIDPDIENDDIVMEKIEEFLRVN